MYSRVVPLPYDTDEETGDLPFDDSLDACNPANFKESDFDEVVTIKTIR